MSNSEFKSFELITAGLWKHTVWRIHKFQLLYGECNYVEYKAPREAVFAKYSLSEMQWFFTFFPQIWKYNKLCQWIIIQQILHLKAE